MSQAVSDVADVSAVFSPGVAGEAERAQNAALVPWIKPKLRPSLLPMIDAEREGCGLFLPQDENEVLEAGRDRHEALRKHFQGDDTLLDLLDADDKEGVCWAADYIRQNIPYLDAPMIWETTRVLVSECFDIVMEGTPDLTCSIHVVDLKWRRRDYTAQFVAYLKMVFVDLRDVHGIQAEKLVMHALWGAFQRYNRHEWTEAEVDAELARVLAQWYNPSPVPKACAYCGWCARRLNCPAFNLPAVVVAQNREDWSLQTYHISEITDPADMAKAILLATHLKKWCEAVDWHKREWAIKRGIKIPGFTVKDEKGDREISDLNRALQLSGIPAEKFIQACGIGIGKLKEIWAEHHNVTKAQADREINQKLAPVIVRTPGKTVVKEK